jgi:hypothetical protein
VTDNSSQIDAASPQDPVPPPPPNPVDSPAAFRAALLWGFEAAIVLKARRITCVAPQFGDWPLDDGPLLTRLGRWLREPEHELVLLALGYDGLGLRLPRFDQWRRDWTHAISPWCCPADPALVLTTCLFADRRVSVRLLEPDTGVGRASLEPRTRLNLAEQCDVLLQRSERAWPVKPLGL